MEISAGRVIRFRNRLWRVDRVDGTTFTATPVEGRHGSQAFLRSVEENACEPAEPPLPDPSIVSTVMYQRLLRAATAVRLLAGRHPLDPLRRSAAIVEPYQLVPLVASSRMDPVRLLIADDVGLGKSIEAGLVACGLLDSGRASNALFAVPASLREQWRLTLLRFFGIRAAVVCSRTRPSIERDLLPGRTPWDAFDVVISSHDYLQSRSGEVLSRHWDLIVADEAHRLARPHSASGCDRGAKGRWEFLRTASTSPKVKHLVLVTATPHQGRRDAFASLLAALDPACVDRAGKPVRGFAASKVVQRRRSDVESWCGGRKLPSRLVSERVAGMSAASQALVDGVRLFCRAFLTGINDPVAPWVALHLLRRALSSPAAILASVERRIAEILGESAARPPLSGAGGVEEAQSAVLDTETTLDLSDEERWSMLDRAAHTNSAEEVEALLKIAEAARKATPSRDLKLACLVTALADALSSKRCFSRAIVFTRYAETMDYLVGRLRRESERMTGLHGAHVFGIGPRSDHDGKAAALRGFEAADRSILVATDCLAEGADLQRACAELVHFDLPWNVGLFEQRNGRIDRYGQPAESVGVTALACADETDAAALELVVRRAVGIRARLGACPLAFESAAEMRALARRFGKAGQLTLDLFEAPVDAPEVEAFPSGRVTEIARDSFFDEVPVRRDEVERLLAEHASKQGGKRSVEDLVLGSLDPGRGDRGINEPSVIEVAAPGVRPFRATFDPETYAVEHGIEFLSPAHPFVRRLADLTVADAARSGTGRLAAFESPLINELTALVHAVVRFSTDSGDRVFEELVCGAFEPGSRRVLPPGFEIPPPAGPCPVLSGERVAAAAKAAIDPDLIRSAIDSGCLGSRPESAGVVTVTLILPAGNEAARREPR